VNNEFERIWKEAAIVFSEVLCRHVPEETEENHDKAQSGQSVSGSRYETGTYGSLDREVTSQQRVCIWNERIQDSEVLRTVTYYVCSIGVHLSACFNLPSASQEISSPQNLQVSTGEEII
jgi:hypothetical protein